jgi:hypothetical protein
MFDASLLNSTNLMKYKMYFSLDCNPKDLPSAVTNHLDNEFTANNDDITKLLNLNREESARRPTRPYRPPSC